MQFHRPVIASITSALIVATAAAAWAVASPAGISCAFAAEQSLIAAAPSESAGFVAAINNLRTSKGLNPLAVDGNLGGIAQDWANEMALADGISHRADLKSGVTGDWSTLGENVGVGPSVGLLMEAFIASPGHYKNLVDPRFTHVGVGTVRVGGLLYTAHEFMAANGAAVSPAPLPAPTPVATVAPRVRAVAAPKGPTVNAPVAEAPAVTAPSTTQAPTTAVPAPPAPETEVTQLPTEKQLGDGRNDNQKQQQSKGDSRCGSQNRNLQAVIG